MYRNTLQLMINESLKKLKPINEKDLCKTKNCEKKALENGLCHSCLIIQLLKKQSEKLDNIVFKTYSPQEVDNIKVTKAKSNESFIPSDFDLDVKIVNNKTDETLIDDKFDEISKNLK